MSAAAPVCFVDGRCALGITSCAPATCPAIRWADQQRTAVAARLRDLSEELAYRINNGELRWQSPPCLHRGSPEGDCQCGAQRYHCNHLGMPVRTRARPGHPADLVCGSACPKYTTSQ